MNTIPVTLAVHKNNDTIASIPGSNQLNAEIRTIGLGVTKDNVIIIMVVQVFICVSGDVNLTSTLGAGFLNKGPVWTLQ